MEALSVVAGQKDSAEESTEIDIKFKGIMYLVDCYERVCNEESTGSKVRITLFLR